MTDVKQVVAALLERAGADRRRKPTTTQPESVLSGRRNEDL